MRYLICGVLAGLLLVGPAWAQSGAQDNKPVNAGPKAADGKTLAAPSQQAKPNPPAPPAPQSSKDDSMGSYDVTGSSANDAMGTAP